MALSSVVKTLTEAAFPNRKSFSSSTEVISTNGTSDKDKNQHTETNDPTSDAALSLSSSFPSFASFKDQRAFEHDRQRAKRSEEYLRTQEAKAASRLGSHFKPSPAVSARQRRSDSVSTTSTPSTSRKDRRIGSDASSSDDEVDTPDVLEGVIRTCPGSKKDISQSPNDVRSAERSEMKLVDLIRPSSFRKSRKNKDVDFELVPAVRPVIVLDELAFLHDIPQPRDLEQEWQHVYHSDGDDSDTSIPTRTYAKVVVNGSK